jgi:predicted enzyme related to lactoylglutathione lyase
MMLTVANITFDCADAVELATFWSAAVEKPIDDGANQYFATITTGGPTLMFIQVPENKAAKNRCHVDFTAEDREAEVKRLVDHGADHVADREEYGHRWTVLRDPSGNEFCVASPKVA